MSRINAFQRPIVPAFAIPALIIVALGSGGLTACQSLSQWQRRHAVERVEEHIGARIAALPLAELSHGETADAFGRIRFVLATDSVTVDNAAQLGALTDAQLQQIHDGAAEALSPEGTKAAEGGDALAFSAEAATPGDSLITDAIDTMLQLQGLTESMLKVDRRDEAYVFVGADVPISSLSALLERIGSAGFRAAHLGAATPKGTRFVPIETPAACAPRAVEEGEKMCALPEMFVSSAGVTVRASTRAATRPHCALQIPEGDEIAWRSRVMLSESKSCPSVPSEEGAQNLKALTRLMREVSAITPGCEHATVSAAASTPWSEVASVVLATQGHSPFPKVTVATATTDMNLEQACAAGMRPTDLPRVAKQLAARARGVKHLNIMGIIDDLQD